MGLTSSYLFLYNLASLGLWSTLTFQLLSSLYNLTDENDTTTLSNLSTSLYPLLQTTQSLAVLEVFHSLLGLVRAGIMTTAMQVSSRLLLVWGVMFVFSPFSRSEDFPIWTVPGGKFNLLGAHGKEVRASDWAFAGCVLAWGVTECIRYSFFVLQLSGKGVPKFLLWLRYNTFFVLYPLGISCECALIYLTAAYATNLNPILRGALYAILLTYIPGSFVLYTHMMAQRRKVIKVEGKKKAV